MKRIKGLLKIGLLMLVLSVGFSKTTDADEQMCNLVTIICMDGHGSNCRICGSSYAEQQLEYAQFYTAICGAPL